MPPKKVKEGSPGVPETVKRLLAMEFTAGTAL
jgi:hypothetical protein